MTDPHDPRTDAAVDRLLRDFFPREMPPDLRALPDASWTLAARPRPAPSRTRGRIAYAVFAAVCACGLAAVLVWSRRHDANPPVIADGASRSDVPVVGIEGGPESHDALRPAPVAPREDDPTVALSRPRDPKIARNTDRPSPSVEDRRSPPIGRSGSLSIPAAFATADSSSPIEAPKPPQVVLVNDLGVTTGPPPPLSADQPFAPLGGATGLAVVEVLPNSPAGAAGLLPGDILITLDGESLDSSGRLRDLVDAAAPGSSVRLEILRRTEPLTVTVVLGRKAELRGGASP